MKKVLVIVGPTGVGKTGLAIELAEKYNGEIVSADSRQVYQGLDIGTGKEVDLLPSGRAKKGKGFWVVDSIKVNLYDACKLDETFTAAQFKKSSEKLINNLLDEGKLPIIVGGTGLYVSSLINNYQFPPKGSTPKIVPSLRQKSSAALGVQPLKTGGLFEELKKVDPVTAVTIDPNNPVRILRALAVFQETGKSIKEQQTTGPVSLDYLVIGLTLDRNKLYQKVDRQVESWVKLGLVEEVEKLLDSGYSPSLPTLQSMHYKQVLRFLSGEIIKAEMVQKIKFERHAYIRRQYTWFNQEKQIRWFDILNEKDKLIETINSWYNQDKSNELGNKFIKFKADFNLNARPKGEPKTHPPRRKLKLS